MAKLSKTFRILTIAILGIEGAYLLGYCKIKEYHPITLEEYKRSVTPERAKTITEKDLLIDGKPLQISIQRPIFSIWRMIAGAMLGGAGAWLLLELIQKVGIRKLNKEKTFRKTTPMQILSLHTSIDQTPRQMVLVVLLMVLIAGTAMNIFHEFVAEGLYGDPSFMDLWLDQVGILLAMAVYCIVTLKILGNRSFRR